ncbi:hypothetical protein PIB30_064618, partial [Stylosanthes scabra]|nr:hypothetical protein [Stylosanthes scabra]
MIVEIIDLTGESPSPPPLPSSRRSASQQQGPTILNFANATTTPPATSVWPPSMHIYDPSLNPSHRYYHHQQLQATNDNNNNNNDNGSSFFYPPYMHVDQHQHQAAAPAPAVTTAHEPLISQSQQTEFMFSHPNNNFLAADDWTLKEH